MSFQSVDPRGFLETSLADVLCVALFAAGGVALSEALLLFPIPRAPLGVALTLLGPLACAIERGRLRQSSWAWSAGLATLATGLHLATLAAWRSPLEPTEIALRVVPLFALGLPLTRLGRWLDRGETDWREACRHGPPHGTPPLAPRISGFQLPWPWRLVLLPLLPFNLAVKALSLAMILLYQLTFSRLMPPACRYEPSCSRYGFQAFLHHGWLRGGVLTAFRLLRCSPIGAGGHDPIPDPDSRWSGWVS